MAQKSPREPTWYERGWDDYDSRRSLGEGLHAMRLHGEVSYDRRNYARGWRDALVVDLCDDPKAPKWMKEEMGI